MRFLIVAVLLFCASLPLHIQAQQPEIIKLPQLEKLLNPESDTTYVINFWATWCKPCVKEMPYFEQLGKRYKNSKVKVVLISLDFKRQYHTTLIPFIKKNKILNTVYLIDEPDYNKWIDKVDPSWSGAIPATIIINSRKEVRKFYEQEFTYEELESVVKPILNL